MAEEVLEALQVGMGRAAVAQTFLDLTLGAGGHTERILRAEPMARVIGVDRDQETLQNTCQRLAPFGDRFRGFWSRFDLAGEVAGAEGPFDGVLLDLGMSSIQVDDPGRGFSFSRDGELDLRMDRSSGESAAELLARSSESEIAHLLFRYGEERRSRAIAKALVMRRRSAPIRRTSDLVDVVLGVMGTPRRAQIHPATRTFQALRIAVNDELGCLERVLPQALDWLVASGRMVILSFHSLEDRIVKRYFQAAAREGKLRLVTRKPLQPSAAEVQRNRRARSAKLRAIEKRSGDGKAAA